MLQSNLGSTARIAAATRANDKQYSITGLSYTNYRFTGKEFDQSTGLYYFGARYYMPEIGRFITPDPAGKFEKRDPKTINLYAYCTDNPLRYVDPSGKWRTTNARYAWAMTNEFALREFVSSFGPFVGLASCYVRSSTGDITLSTGDWVWAGVDIALTLIPAAKVVTKSGSEFVKAVVNAGPYALNAIINEGVFTEVRLDRIIWRIAEREGIVSADMTIDLDARHGKVRSKFEAIDMFVKAVDKSPTHLPEIYKKDIYKEWYEIYKRETPWYVYKE